MKEILPGDRPPEFERFSSCILTKLFRLCMFTENIRLIEGVPISKNTEIAGIVEFSKVSNENNIGIPPKFKNLISFMKGS